LTYACQHRDETLETMQRWAQELDPDVIWAHVDTYVNRWTEDLGPVGSRALAVMHRLAAERGLAPAGMGELEILGVRPGDVQS
jgi:1,4-dihydroxy-6-naphthoate synthase